MENINDEEIGEMKLHLSWYLNTEEYKLLNHLDEDVTQGLKIDVDLALKYIEQLEEKDKQIKYLHSGEYINQLRYERDMLQHLVDTNKIPEFDKKWIDCTHRNTELLEENKLLKKQIDFMAEEIRKDRKTNNNISDEEYIKRIKRYFKQKARKENE